MANVEGGYRYTWPLRDVGRRFSTRTSDASIGWSWKEKDHPLLTISELANDKRESCAIYISLDKMKLQYSLETEGGELRHIDGAEFLRCRGHISTGMKRRVYADRDLVQLLQ